jgi:hypothetical protein
VISGDNYDNYQANRGGVKPVDSELPLMHQPEHDVIREGQSDHGDDEDTAQVISDIAITMTLELISIKTE